MAWINDHRQGQVTHSMLLPLGPVDIAQGTEVNVDQLLNESGILVAVALMLAGQEALGYLPSLPPEVQGLGEFLGKGGSSYVYAATCQGQECAVKLLYKPGPSEPMASSYADLESTLLNQLQQSLATTEGEARNWCFPRVLHSFEHGLVLSPRGKAVPATHVRRAVYAAAQALVQAHAAGIMHRDCRLCNILLLTKKGFCIIDWGYGCYIDNSAQGWSGAPGVLRPADVLARPETARHSMQAMWDFEVLVKSFLYETTAVKAQVTEMAMEVSNNAELVARIFALADSNGLLELVHRKEDQSSLLRQLQELAQAEERAFASNSLAPVEEETLTPRRS